MLEPHPLAELFPMMRERESADLRADLVANGLTDTIVLYEGKILDGRNRYRACLDVGIVPHTRLYTGPDPLAFVLSKNLHRRHLDESQRAMVAAKIADLPRGGDKSKLPRGSLSVEQAADMLNVGERNVFRAKHVRESGVPELVDAVSAGVVTVREAERIADLPQAEQHEIVARGRKEIVDMARLIRAEEKSARRIVNLQRLGHLADTSSQLAGFQKYSILYADPPWLFEAGFSDRSVENHYPTMTLDQICAMPVGKRATDDALLVLWTTAPCLRLAFDVLDAWDFTYKTELVWDKKRTGLGFWARGRHEPLLIATRGNFPAPLPGTQLASVIEEARGPHSRKPACVAEWIERTWPDLPKLELFCRTPRPGWDVWGNQAEQAA